MNKNKWEYGGVYEKYDMNGEINIGGGILKVHNIFDELPEFMMQADCVFIDPPCSIGNINTFYTKAGRSDYQSEFQSFTNRFFNCIRQIKPKKIFIEVFKSNKRAFENELARIYGNISVYESTYYHKKQNKCWILIAGDVEADKIPEGMDEKDFIKWVCANIQYECIGDLCMGRGLVGYHAFLNKKRFVGTELNGKRLAVLVDKISIHKKQLKTRRKI